jgi:aspartate carbamoyltransferase regulatory subunit
MKEELKVSKIKNGTVIDHLAPSSALKIFNALNIGNSSGPVIVAVNVESSAHGRKDLIKIENRFLSKEETDKLSILSPKATINIIRDYAVVEKRGVKRPDILKRVVVCPNKKCVTNFEPCETRFLKEGDNYRCYFCERVFKIGELKV